MKTYIFGHRNPDTDSICAAISYSYLKNQLGEDCEPRRLGEIQRETQFILDRFRISPPALLDNVKIQVKDLQYTKIRTIFPHHSIFHAYHEMEAQSLKTMAIVDDQSYLKGLVTMKDIAMDMLQGDFYNIDTTIGNILEGLEASKVNSMDDALRIKGRVAVVAYYVTSLDSMLTEDRIIIVGDRYDVIESAIKKKVKLIVVSGGFELPQKLIDLAQEHKVPIIVSAQDSYIISKRIQQCNFITTVMENRALVKFDESDYLEEVKDDIVRSNYRNFPVISDEGKFLGFVGRKHLLNPGRKKVILVDHNEMAQSAKGVEEAEILEILDHHKIGGLSTMLPIRFINLPVGSSCTIIYDQYRQHGIVPPKEIAALMLSGILSDTLFFKSPTCTRKDQEVAKELNEIVGLDMEKYFMEMFRAGTSIEGYSEEEILRRDFKDFKFGEFKIGIAQIFTLDIDEVLIRQDDLLEFMRKEKNLREYKAILLAVTDIVREGSYFFFASDIEGILDGSFEIDDKQGAFAPWIVSRKKQIVPMIMSYIENNF